MRPFRVSIPTAVVVAVLVAGGLLSAVTSVAVVVAMRESLARLPDPTSVAISRSLVNDMLFWSFLVWVPFGALLAWWAGRRLAEPLEQTRLFAREQAWSEHPARRTGARVTEVRRLEEALSGYFADLRDEMAAALRGREEAVLLVNAVGEGILQLDERGHLVRLNPAAARLLHLPGEALGQPISALVRHPDLRALLERPMQDVALESTEISVEGRHLLVVRQPLVCRGETGGAVVLVVDLTPLRRLEDVRRDFVANVSHELKTPLTAIRGFAETLQDDDLPPELRRQFLDATLRNAERLQRIVDDLLDLSRIESGGWRPRASAVDAPALARDAWVEFRARAEENGVAFDVLDEAHQPVGADPDGLRQILSNLYDNALRYTPRNGRITVRVRRADPQPGQKSAGGAAKIAIEVADTGSGIPGDALQRIFERFYRVDPSRSRAEGGTGLGLSIVKHLAERMGGDVVAESRLGSGTTMRVTLPAATLALAPTAPRE
jgi:signal transduction histidine kinase